MRTGIGPGGWLLSLHIVRSINVMILSHFILDLRGLDEDGIDSMSATPMTFIMPKHAPRPSFPATPEPTVSLGSLKDVATASIVVDVYTVPVLSRDAIAEESAC